MKSVLFAALFLIASPLWAAPAAPADLRIQFKKLQASDVLLVRKFWLKKIPPPQAAKDCYKKIQDNLALLKAAGNSKIQNPELKSNILSFDSFLREQYQAFQNPTRDNLKKLIAEGDARAVSIKRQISSVQPEESETEVRYGEKNWFAGVKDLRGKLPLIVKQAESYSQSKDPKFKKRLADFSEKSAMLLRSYSTIQFSNGGREKAKNAFVKGLMSIADVLAEIDSSRKENDEPNRERIQQFMFQYETAMTAGDSFLQDTKGSKPSPQKISSTH